MNYFDGTGPHENDRRHLLKTPTQRVLLFGGWYSPKLCQLFPELMFVFGDNLLGFGKGGQAIIRNEPNAFGVPTKRKPSMGPGSFFSEDCARDLDAVLLTLGELWPYLEDGGFVVFPVNNEGEISLGLERAKLKEKAPSIYDTISNHVKEMSDSYGCLTVADSSSLESYFPRK